MKQEDNFPERYKKLKQSDRMEYLAIDSVYENRDNSYLIILALSNTIKFFILIPMLFISIVSAMESSGASISVISNEFIKMPIGMFFGLLLMAFIIQSIDFSVLMMTYFNTKASKKRMDEFLTERNK